MRVVPERSPWLQLATVLGGFLVGPYAGLRLGVALAPGSDFVQTVSTFGMALVFVGGLLLWMGLGILTVVTSFLWRVVRGRRPGPERLAATDQLIPAGYRSFIGLGVAMGVLIGLIAAVASDLTLVPALAVWSLAGLGYGLLLSAAAHHGWLPFPEPE